MAAAAPKVRVQPKGFGTWRATVFLNGKYKYGPSRAQEAAAEADVRLVQAATDKAGMAVVLTRLKHEAQTAREAAVEEKVRVQPPGFGMWRATVVLTGKKEHCLLYTSPSPRDS